MIRRVLSFLSIRIGALFFPVVLLMQELDTILHSCNPQPCASFCLAIEEGEAWLLGDVAAIKAAYPRAKDRVLQSYVQDSICGTWEKLADAITPGGAQKLKQAGRQAAGYEKVLWAAHITPHMHVERNNSPSFQAFCTRIRTLLTGYHDIVS